MADENGNREPDKTFLVTIEDCPAETTPDEVAGYIMDWMLRTVHAWELDPTQKSHFLKVREKNE